MKVYIVCHGRDYHGISGILKVFVDEELADKYKEFLEYTKRSLQNFDEPYKEWHELCELEKELYITNPELKNIIEVNIAPDYFLIIVKDIEGE